MTWAEKICSHVRADIKPQAISLANAVSAMQSKIEQQTAAYLDEPLAQEVTLGTGQTTLRANPILQEYRATVRDYAQALNNLQSILGQSSESADIKSLDSLRSKLKVAK